MEDLLEMYDYIEINRISDITDLLMYAMTGEEYIKLGWVHLLENDKIVDLLSCKIKSKNSANYYHL